MNNKFPSLIKCSRLYELMKENSSRLKILDCSYPFTKAMHNFRTSRIPTALFLDLTNFKNKNSQHTMDFPGEDVFREYVEELNISRNDLVVCYDMHGVFSSPRAWFIFKAYNFPNVAVLDGGFVKWKSEKLKIDNTPYGEVQVRDFSYFKVSETVADEIEKEEYKYDHNMLATYEEIVKGGKVIIDTRPERYFEIESIPNSFNLFYDRFVNSDFTLKSKEELQSLFKKSGINIEKDSNIVSSCGFGLSACVGYFAVSEILNHSKVKLYNGSLEEYSAKTNN
jgi:thiosulfate/3-mercaptopyruvate sulfurtransferase